MPGPYGSTDLKICLDLELICRGGVLDFQMLMVKVKFHALAVIGVAGQAQQLVHALLLLLRVEQVARALLAGAAYLLVRRVIDWRVPVSYLGTLAVLNLAFGEPVLDSVLLGGTVLGAFFMATDYVTSPVPAWGKVLYGIGIGAINFAIRQWGAYPEGVTYAILLMNIASPLLERATRPRKYGEVKRRA